ncbi:MAG TPA: LytR C-terminal domain-containing protein [Jatrophihabitantaceae bacterium]|jgi:hypothetical protein|nr:LytR C-terminal domain-containing protein [Jatrophihabitantaceae bacterium]
MTSPPSAPSGGSASEPGTRRPLPALVFLLALTLLAALVWWRVLARSSDDAAAGPTCTPSTAAAQPKQLPEQEAITVTVLNSTKRQGIATKAQRALVQDGFQAPASAANDSKAYPGYSGKITGVAEIRYGPDGSQGAQLLQYYFPGAKLVKTNSKDSTVLVSLGTKYKNVASQHAVTAALKADAIKLVPVAGAPDLQSSSSACGTASPAAG